MSEQISIHQIGPLTSKIDAPLSDAVTFIEYALSTVEKVVLPPITTSRIEGEYKFGGGDLLVPFAFNLTEISENVIQADLQFTDDAPAWRTDMIREAIGKALCETYNPDLPVPAKDLATNTSETYTAPKDPRAPKSTLAVPRANIAPASDYKTTSGLGSFFAIIGWLGVAVSIFAGFLAAQTVGLAGVAAGFIAAFFCLMTVAAGQLLRAQVEVANNSRLILMHLDKLARART